MRYEIGMTLTVIIYIVLVANSLLIFSDMFLSFKRAYKKYLHDKAWKEYKNRLIEEKVIIESYKEPI